MANEWNVELGSERFSVTVRPSAQSGSFIYQIDRLSPPRERIGEIHEGADGKCAATGFRSEAARKTLDALLPLIHKQFHSVTRRLPKSER